MPQAAGEFLVCGLGNVGLRVVELLCAAGLPAVVLTREATAERTRLAGAAGARVLFGDARDDAALLGAGLASARALLLLTSHDVTNVAIALDAQRLAPEVPIVMRLFDATLAEELELAFGVRRAAAVSAIAAPVFAGAALGEGTLASFSSPEGLFVVESRTLDAASPLAGSPATGIPPGLSAVLVSASREGVPATGTLAAGDRVVLCGLKTKLEELHPGPVREARPASRNPAEPTLLATLRQAFVQSSTGLKAALAALLGLALLSVGVFSFTLSLPVEDAIYFVVTTVTTTGYGDVSLLKAPLLVKLFGCLLMVLGSAALGILYSLLTGFVVTQRFEELLGRRRVPRHGHVVVLGLGNVGLRLLASLRNAGVPVVLLEHDERNEYLATVRRDVPSVIGDARSEVVLRAAGVAEARAIVAVTGDDAVNLGAGLLARKIATSARVVIRLFDPDLARKVESSGHVDAALSASRAAAPFFVASALAPFVKAAFVSEGTLWALVGRTSEPGSPDPLARAGVGLVSLARVG
ncbi:MAG: NAD-binding protein [Acidobacteria bacterium]|nr:NAD-binding protein [Acidobacteriota bacterium]